MQRRAAPTVLFFSSPPPLLIRNSLKLNTHSPPPSSLLIQATQMTPPILSLSLSRECCDRINDGASHTHTRARKRLGERERHTLCMTDFKEYGIYKSIRGYEDTWHLVVMRRPGRCLWENEKRKRGSGGGLSGAESPGRWWF